MITEMEIEETTIQIIKDIMDFLKSEMLNIIEIIGKKINKMKKINLIVPTNIIHQKVFRKKN